MIGRHDEVTEADEEIGGRLKVGLGLGELSR